MFDLREHLKSLGYESDWDYEDTFAVMGDKFRIRVSFWDDRIDIGFTETFDRWGNSVDLVAKCPHTQEDLDKIFETLGSMVKCQFNTGIKWGCCSWLLPRDQHKVGNKRIVCVEHQKRHTDRAKKRRKGHLRRHH